MIKLIAGLFGGITSLIGVIFAFFSRKMTTVAAGLLTFAALVGIFIACINSLVNTVNSYIDAAQSLVMTAVLTFVGVFIPGNFAACMGAIVSSMICRAAFDIGRKKTDIVVNGN